MIIKAIINFILIFSISISMFLFGLSVGARVTRIKTKTKNDNVAQDCLYKAKVYAEYNILMGNLTMDISEEISDKHYNLALNWIDLRKKYDFLNKTGIQPSYKNLYTLYIDIYNIERNELKPNFHVLNIAKDIIEEQHAKSST